MTITKLGHCCLLLQIAAPNGVVKILTDPGMYSSAQNDLTGIDFVLITHEHADHYHIDSVKAIMTNNPNAAIVSNGAVAALLKKEGFASTIVAHGDATDLKGVSLRGWGTKHAVIYKEFGQVENTGYFINGELWYPGDAFTAIDWKADIVALPVAGPWMKISEAIEYVLSIKPKKCFPVHDAIYASPKFVHGMLKTILEKDGVVFTPLEAGQKSEF
ncbi:MAG: MBL fold metallo-hydrolase [Candidatus Pacebacteria bacterium]|nr:MBL fold metallo-hydrolase [Candidatus Paceibacterota bacterium]